MNATWTRRPIKTGGNYNLLHTTAQNIHVHMYAGGYTYGQDLTKTHVARLAISIAPRMLYILFYFYILIYIAI